jgi:hypothetical protein
MIPSVKGSSKVRNRRLLFVDGDDKACMNGGKLLEGGAMPALSSAIDELLRLALPNTTPQNRRAYAMFQRRDIISPSTEKIDSTRD